MRLSSGPLASSLTVPDGDDVVAFFHEESNDLPRSRDSDSSSVSSVASYRFLRRTTTKDSIDLDGQPRTFTLSQLCDFIVKHPSLHSAQIVSCSSYVQRTAVFVPHRFLIFQLQRAGRKDVWLRLDRKTAEEAGMTGLARRLGVTDANDVARIAATQKELFLGSPTCENELFFNSPCSLSVLRHTLLAVIDVMTQYKLGSENCWAFCSLLQENLLKANKSEFRAGQLNHPTLAAKARFRVDLILLTTRLRSANTALAQINLGNVQTLVEIVEIILGIIPYVQLVQPSKDAFAALCRIITRLLESIIEPILSMGNWYGIEFPIAMQRIVDEIKVHLGGPFNESPILVNSGHTASYVKDQMAYVILEAKEVCIRTMASSEIWAIFQLGLMADTLFKGKHISDQISRLRVADVRYTTTARELEGCTTKTLHMILGRLNKLENTARTVRLRGPPGSGKTPVAKSVATSLNLEKRLSASFFFDKSWKRENAAPLDLFVTTLAAQVAKHNPWYCSTVAEIISDTPSILNQLPATQLDSLLIDPLQAICTKRPDLITDSFIVIDGLEECGTPDDVDELKKLVARLEDLPAPFRILLSCRLDFPSRKTRSPSSAPAGHADFIVSTPLEEDPKASLSAAVEGTVSKYSPHPTLWDTNTEAVGKTLEGHTSSVRSVSFSPDASCIISGSYDGAVRIWDAVKGKATEKLTNWRNHSGRINAVSFSPDSWWIASGSDDNNIRLWDMGSHWPIGEPIMGHTGWVQSLVFSPDGKRIISGSNDRTIRIWDAESRKPVGDALQGHTAAVLSVAISQDGRRIVSGSADKTIRLWNAESGEVIGEPLRGHTGIVVSVSLSPDGRRIASGSSDETVRMWDAESGEAIGDPLRGHTGSVNAVSFFPDGGCIASGSSDRTIRVWHAESGEAIGEPLLGHTGVVEGISFPRDGKHMVSCSEESVRIWDPLLTLSFSDNFS